jgi:hypothetical protein
LAGDPLLDQQQTSIPSILQTLIFTPDLVAKLNGIDVCLNAIDDDVAKKVKAAQIRKILHEKYLDDVEFMRRLKLYSTMMGHTELAAELLGQDFLSHPEFNFSEELEHELAELNKFLNKIIGLLIKEYQQGEKIEF